MAGRPDVVGGHYRVGQRIGEGSFGVIYSGTTHIVYISSLIGLGVNELNSKKVAIKFVPTTPKTSN